MKPKQKKEKVASNIISMSDSEPIRTDSIMFEMLRDRMSASDRENYDYILKAVEISIETGRLSVFPQLIKQKEEIERRYETSDDDAIVIAWDEAAIKEVNDA